MALLRNMKRYLRLHLNSYSIQNGFIIISYSQYASKEIRDFEKDSGEKIKNFFEKVNQKLKNKIEELEKYQMTYFPSARENIEAYNDLQKDENFKYLICNLNKFKEDIYLLQDSLFNTGNAFNLNFKEEFIDLGLEENWEGKYIKVENEGRINIGLAPQLITDEVLYTMTKKMMPNSIDC